MIVYHSTKSAFLDTVFKHDIEAVILSAFRSRVGHGVSRAEVRSWKESLLAMAKVVNDDAIPGECGVAVEYGIPQTSKRIDMLLSGTSHPSYGSRSYNSRVTDKATPISDARTSHPSRTAG